MARFNEILAGRYNRYLQKLFQLKGGPPAAQLASEVMAVFPLFGGAENRYLEGWSRWGGFVALAAAGVGNLSGLQLRNKPSSNVVAIVEKVFFSGLLADQPKLRLSGVDTVDAPTPITAQTFDNRLGMQSSSCNLSSSSGAAAIAQFGSIIWQGSAAANFNLDAIFTDIEEVTLLPGSVLQLVGNVSNQALNAAVWWRERSLEESELK